MGDLYLGFICVFIVSINQSTDELEKNKNEENLEGNISLGKGENMLPGGNYCIWVIHICD
jgi:hypothetical protein